MRTNDKQLVVYMCCTFFISCPLVWPLSHPPGSHTRSPLVCSALLSVEWSVSFSVPYTGGESVSTQSS